MRVLQLVFIGTPFLSYHRPQPLLGKPRGRDWGITFFRLRHAGAKVHTLCACPQLQQIHRTLAVRLLRNHICGFCWEYCSVQ